VFGQGIMRKILINLIISLDKSIIMHYYVFGTGNRIFNEAEKSRRTKKVR
jgi:hypothetical protein